MSVPVEEPDLRPSALAARTGVYFGSQVMLVVASLIAMPITTRLLPQEQYGLLSLVMATLSLMTIAGTGGFAETTLRFYPERRREGAASLRSFCETMLGGALATSVFVAGCVFVVAPWFEADHPAYARCLRWTALLATLQVGCGIARQIYRCQGRSLALAATEVGTRFLAVLLTVVLLLSFERSAETAIVALAIAFAVFFGVRLADLRAGGAIGRPRVALSAFGVSARYGVPLAVGASASFLLSYGDRFLIGRILGLEAVAVYSVPYDVADRLVEVLFTPIALAVMPALYDSWAREGRAATSAFASRVLTVVLAGAIPIAVLFLLFSDSVIALLASERYRSAATLTPVLLPGVMLSGLNFIVVAGLTVEKRTARVAVHVLGVAVLNVVLNLVLIPWWGLTGAAVATTVAYAVLVAANGVAARASFRLRPQWRIVARSVLATVLMVVLLQGIGPVSSVSNLDLVVRGPLGAAMAFVSLWALEPELRQWMRVR